MAHLMNDVTEMAQEENQPMPGAFTTSVSLTLHTKTAALFFHGRRGDKTFGCGAWDKGICTFVQ